jgi:hypothetical protein
MDFLSKFYGNFSTGAGMRLKKPDDILSKFSDKKIINEYKKSISKDLKKTKIDLTKVENPKIMDIGTGRQSLALSEIFKGQVYHYDINKKNVQNLKKIIIDKKLKKKIISKAVDVVKFNKFNNNYFDLVYLQGIVQHFSKPDIGIIKLLKTVKKGGYAWIYFYKSGTFMQFCNYALRDIFHNSNIVNKISIKSLHSIINNSKKKIGTTKKNLFIFDSFIDSLFVPYAWLFEYKTVRRAFKNSNFKIIKEVTCSKNEFKYNHSIKHSAFIISLKKTSKNMKVDTKFLSKQYSVNQLKINYKNPEMKKIVYNFNKLKKLFKLNNSDIDKVIICFRIYKKTFQLNFSNVTTNFKYKELNNFLLMQIDYVDKLQKIR